MKRWIAVLVMSALFCRADGNREAALDTIAQINHINWIYNTIRTYNNAIVLEEEYEKISPGRLNLNRIPDEEALDHIIKMLDCLHDLRKDEHALKQWRNTFDADRKKKIRDYWMQKAQSASIDGLTEKVKGWAGSTMASPALAIVQVSWSGAFAAMNEYNDYQDFTRKIEDEGEQHLFELGTKKLDDIHERNKDMLKEQWNLIRKYDLSDSLRVSDQDIRQLVECLKDSNHERVWSRIEPMKERFANFPTYWYYLSCAAVETGRWKEGIEACDTFFKINRGLFRNDPMEGGVAINKAFMLEKTEANKPEIRRCLELFHSRNSGEENWRRDCLAASLWKNVFNDQANAERSMQHAISLLEVSVAEHLRSAGGSSFDNADGESLWECRRFLEQLREENFAADEERLKSLCSGELTSSVEKLYYLGKMHSRDIWPKLKDDVLELRLSCPSKVDIKKGISRNISATVPVRWFLSGAISLQIEVFSCGKKIAVSKEETSRRTLRGANLLQCVFDLPGDAFAQADEFRLVFDHAQGRSEFVFSSNTPYRDREKASAAGLFSIRTGIGLADGKFSPAHLTDELFLYEATLLGTTMRWQPTSTFGASEYSATQKEEEWLDKWREVFPQLRPLLPSNVIERGMVESLFFDEKNGELRLHWRNNGKEDAKPRASIYLLNRFGSVVARFDDVWKIKKLKPGESAETVFRFERPGVPSFADIETE